MQCGLGQCGAEEREIDGIGSDNDGSVELPRSGAKIFCGPGGTSLRCVPYFGYLGRNPVRLPG
jgi:hypothetical protein